MKQINLDKLPIFLLAIIAVICCFLFKINWFWTVLSTLILLISIPLSKSIIIDDVRYYLVGYIWGRETYNNETKDFGITVHEWGRVEFYSALSHSGEKVIIKVYCQKASYGQDFDFDQYPEDENTEKYSLSSEKEVSLEKKKKEISSLEKRIENLKGERKKLTSIEGKEVDQKIKELLLEVEQLEK